MQTRWLASLCHEICNKVERKFMIKHQGAAEHSME